MKITKVQLFTLFFLTHKGKGIQQNYQAEDLKQSKGNAIFMEWIIRMKFVPTGCGG